MARYRGPRERLSRREGVNLFLKGERALKGKSGVDRRQGGPGQHGKGRKSNSDYKMQLREKQKAKAIYGVLEKQMRRYYEEASRTKGVTGSILVLMLERRVDNMVYRLGFAATRYQSRQLVTHGHILVNGKKVQSPSYVCSPGDTIEVRSKMKTNAQVLASMQSAQSRVVPEWLALDVATVKGTIVTLPQAEQVQNPFNPQLIVELYSR